MQRIGNGLIAGLAATVVLSVLMILKAMIGLMPELNAIEMLAGIAANLTGGTPSPFIGWVLHVLIGVLLWGVLFALLSPVIPGARYWVKGVIFGIGAWVLMMLVPMPMAGAGLFGLELGMGAPLATLVLHVIFGAVLGSAFESLQVRIPTARRREHAGSH